MRPKKPVRGKGPAKPRPLRPGEKYQPGIPEGSPKGTIGVVGGRPVKSPKPGKGKVQPGRPAKPPTRGRRKPVPMPIGPTKPVRGRRKPTPMPIKPTKPVRGRRKAILTDEKGRRVKDRKPVLFSGAKSRRRTR